MSAFVVDDQHINAIVTYAAEKRVSVWNRQTHSLLEISHRNAEEVGRILLDENVRSVVHRYQNSSPDFADEAKNEAAEYKYTPFPVPLVAIEIIKACDCLSYQSCETDDWQETLSWSILQAIKSHACYCLPGYEAAPWEITERSFVNLRHQGLAKAVRLTDLIP